MAKKDKVKKRKLIKKQQPETNNKIEKKKLKKKIEKTNKTLAAVSKKEKDKTPQQQTHPQIHSDSDSDSDSEIESESDKIHNLLAPYSKDQLIDFVVDAAVNDAALSSRIRDAADRDVSHRKIFVSGLGWDSTRETLTSAFDSYGEIEDCSVITDRVTGKAKGYGFVLFKTRQGATKALKQPRKKINNRMTSSQLASVGPNSSSASAASQSHDTAGRKIYVSNVQPDADPEKLRVLFAKFGEIETGPVGFDRHTGKSRGFALFVYKTIEGARKALQEPYKMFEGRQLHCQKAADGKNKVVGSQPVMTAMQPVQPPVLAAVAQNLALFNQHRSLNPMYGGLLVNPNAGMLMAGSVNPMVGLGQGLLGSSQVSGAGGFGASAYGTSAPVMQGLQQAYTSSHIGQTAPARAPGTSSGSFSGYPSYIWYDLFHSSTSPLIGLFVFQNSCFCDCFLLIFDNNFDAIDFLSSTLFAILVLFI
ncbi:hypothetical protein CsSME_00002767 [Camellia sinensis var. sinensis]